MRKHDMLLHISLIHDSTLITHGIILN